MVCARGPSSAATTSSAASISPAPTSMLPTSRSWPGTSTKSSAAPSGSVRWAYPTSIVIPRRRSSGSRSASMPVSARSSVVLPWSMWPGRPDDDGHVGRRRASRPAWASAAPRAAASAASSAGSTVRRSSSDRAVLDPPDDGRDRRRGAARASASRRPAGDDQTDRLERLARQRPAADRRRHLRHRRPATGPSAGSAGEQRVGAAAERLRRSPRSSARPGSRSSPAPPDTAPASRPARPA